MKILIYHEFLTDLKLSEYQLKKYDIFLVCRYSFHISLDIFEGKIFKMTILNFICQKL